MDSPLKIIVIILLVLVMGTLGIWMINKIEGAATPLKEKNQERSEVMVDAILKAKEAKIQIQDATEKQQEILKEAGIEID